MDFFQRKYILNINGKTFQTYREQGDALDIKFDVTFARGAGGAFRQGKVAILGLSDQTISEYLELAALGRGAATARKLRVDLFAGYENGGKKLIRIITGNAYNATITPPPEKWLTLDVFEVDPSGGETYPFTKLNQGTPYKIGDLASELIGNFTAPNGKKYQFSDRTKKKVGEQKVASFGSGAQYSLSNAIIAINQLSKDWVVIVNENQLIAIDASENEAPDEQTVVSADTGLLSVTGIDAKNATITTFLNEEDPLLSKLVLKSELNKQANGNYLILKKQFKGHYHGNEWYTTYFCSGRVK